MASRIRKAVHRVGNGQNQSAISLVSGVLAKVDGTHAPVLGRDTSFALAPTNPSPTE